MAKVHLLKDGRAEEFELPAESAAKPLLERIESTGRKMPHGCRSGSCGSCLVWVKNGMDALSPIDAIERDTLSRCGDASEGRLACRLRVLREDVVLRLETPPPGEDSVY